MAPKIVFYGRKPLPRGGTLKEHMREICQSNAKTFYSIASCEQNVQFLGGDRVKIQLLEGWNC